MNEKVFVFNMILAAMLHTCVWEVKKLTGRGRL
jgi:hypothetical protein